MNVALLVLSVVAVALGLVIAEWWNGIALLAAVLIALGLVGMVRAK